MVKSKQELEDWRTELLNDKYYQHKELKNTQIDELLPLFGKKVNVPEYGTGVIVSVEVFKEYWGTHRFLIEITDNTAKPILKSMFPDNIMAFWDREFTVIN